MRKGERTRLQAVERAADVFSLRGYFGTSMEDLRRATGLEQGGIYNHFRSKEELALAAYDHATAIYRERFHSKLDGRTGAMARLEAFVDVFRSLIDDPIVPGGCMVLNAAVEGDDAQPALRARAEATVNRWRALIVESAEQGIRAGEFRPEVDPQALASVLIGTLEGAVMLSKLYGDPVHMHRAVDHLRGHLASLASDSRPA